MNIEQENMENREEIIKQENRDIPDIVFKSDVDRAVFEIYGKSGWEDFNEE